MREGRRLRQRRLLSGPAAFDYHVPDGASGLVGGELAPMRRDTSVEDGWQESSRTPR
jgi:hypothetical protein